VWLITGCSSGLGAALGKEVLSSGYRAVVTARQPRAISEFENQYPGRALAHRLDITKLDEVNATVKAALEKFSRIDVLVNNAGYGLVGALEEVEDQEIRDIFETNVYGTLNMIRAILPIMRNQKSGHIINLSSNAGFVGRAGAGVYCGAKFAVEGLSEVLAAEVGPLGIKVTIVEPGPYRTDFLGRSIAWTKNVIPDYDATSGDYRRYVKTAHGHQIGDPKLAARAMVTLVEASAPPLRLVLGKTALGLIREKLASVSRELDAWEKVTLST
jgi:NAD(P)-dependent dehydrogenase (short-subunit alcohol dehydrogenase family)